jgi:8-oxo-dGTP pyrophosphatase MutT (NUDIX family)
LCAPASGGILPGVTNRVVGGKGAGPGDPAPLVHDAATVVLLRDGPDGLECLMLRKTEAQVFGGLWVFPGGRVEDRDGTGLEGARRAAVREAAEETGLVLDGAALVPIAHWTPPLRAPRRYLTWFFVAPVPEDAAEVVVDGGEIGDHVWVRPTVALAEHREGKIDLMPPTWMTLRRLAAQADVAEALADAAARPVERFATDIRLDEDGVPVAVWEGDAAYAPARPPGAATDADAAADQPIELNVPGPRHRLTMDPAGWRYERT